MKKKLFLFIAFAVLGILQASIFMVVNSSMLQPYTFAQLLLSLIYSLPQSVMVAAWVMLLPFVAGLAYVFIRGDWHRKFMIRYITAVSVPLTLLCWLGWILYDTTLCSLNVQPFVTFFHSPWHTLTEAPWWSLPVALLLAAVTGWLVYQLMTLIYPRRRSGSISRMSTGSAQQIEALEYLLLSIAMFIIGMGCFGLMGIGSSYHSDQQPLNHAATHPVYSLCHSMHVQGKSISERYDFLTEQDNEKARMELSAMGASHPASIAEYYGTAIDADSAASINEGMLPMLRPTITPNVLFLLLDGPCPADFVQQGIHFSHCYARTRNVLSFCDADMQPRTEVLHFAQPLQGAGYSIGLVSPDEVVDALRAEALNAYDTLAEYPAQPYIRYVATPYTVADGSLNSLVDALRADTLIWNDLLIVALTQPGISAAPTAQIQDPSRYQQSVVWAGGAILDPLVVSVYCQPADIASALFKQLGITVDAAQYPDTQTLLSDARDVFVARDAHYALYTWDDGFGFITDSISYMQDNYYDGHPLDGSIDPTGRAQRFGKALLR